MCKKPKIARTITNRRLPPSPLPLWRRRRRLYRVARSYCQIWRSTTEMANPLIRFFPHFWAAGCGDLDLRVRLSVHTVVILDEGERGTVDDSQRIFRRLQFGCSRSLETASSTKGKAERWRRVERVFHCGRHDWGYIYMVDLFLLSAFNSCAGRKNPRTLCKVITRHTGRTKGSAQVWAGSLSFFVEIAVLFCLAEEMPWRQWQQQMLNVLHI